MTSFSHATLLRNSSENGKIEGEKKFVFEMQEIKKCILLRYTEEKKPGVLMAGDVEVKFDRKMETTKNLAG